VHHTGDANITFEELGPDRVYALPYRIAVPQGLDNTLVAGRGLSATHEAHGAIRVMPTAMAVAQAVGTAAALLAASNQPAAELDPATLREKLRDAGAIL
jgi:FAD-dependent oxidoreductase family protein